MQRSDKFENDMAEIQLSESFFFFFILLYLEFFLSPK